MGTFLLRTVLPIKAPRPAGGLASGHRLRLCVPHSHPEPGQGQPKRPLPDPRRTTPPWTGPPRATDIRCKAALNFPSFRALKGREIERVTVEAANVKSLKGHPHGYRVRIGVWRVVYT
ncbi:MAG: type II toxin-antitoxin system RelE family toxin, partial [bacterium]